MEKLRRSYRFGRQSHHRNRLKLSTRLKPRKDIEPMKVTRKQLEEIIKEETEKILRGEPLETQLLQRVLRDKMTPEKAKKLLPIKLHSDFDDYYAKNIELQKRGARSQEPEEVPGLEEETTDETLDSGYFDQVKPTWKCPEGETMSSKSGKCEPNRVKPSLRQEQ